ncbi:MAG: hypothetical protein V1926_06540 [Candidatus Peregrinibacteria bacterium]
MDSAHWKTAPMMILMRRFPLSLLACTLPLLASCAPAETGLPVPEVLSRAATASGQMQSAHFELDTSFTFTPSPSASVEGSAHMSGVLQDGGRQVQMRIVFDTALAGSGLPEHIAGDLEIIVGSLSETYLFVHRADVTPPHSLFDERAIASLLNRWWLLPVQSGGTPDGPMLLPTGPLSPDPAIIRAQSQVVNVTRDRGMEMMDGRKMYHYETAVDPEKLAAFLIASRGEQGSAADDALLRQKLANVVAFGEIWIDAQTFVIRRISWNAEPFPIREGAGTLGFSMVMDLSEVNAAGPISIPSDAMPFTPLFPLPMNGWDSSVLPIGSKEEQDRSVPSLPQESQLLPD